MVAVFLNTDRLGLHTAFEDVGSSSDFLVLDHLNDVASLENVAEGIFDNAWADFFLFFDFRFTLPFVATDHAFVLGVVGEDIIHCAEWAGDFGHGFS